MLTSLIYLPSFPNMYPTTRSTIKAPQKGALCTNQLFPIPKEKIQDHIELATIPPRVLKIPIPRYNFSTSSLLVMSPVAKLRRASGRPDPKVYTLIETI